MSGMKSLAKDTAVYGLSSIVGRFLNWCLVPLYTHVFAQAEYGVVTYLYSLVALLLIILTYGLETGFFRFANHEKYKDPMRVYTTGLISLAVTSTLFVVLVWIFLGSISSVLGSSGDPRYVMMLAVTLAIDAFTSLPFAYLRYKQRPLRFAGIKLLSIFLNIGLNLFFIVLCPVWYTTHPEWVGRFYDPDFGVGYIFLSNLIASAVTLLVLVPEIVKVRYRFDTEIWRRMIVYSFPLLVMGLAGIMNQTIDKLTILGWWGIPTGRCLNWAFTGQIIRLPLSWSCLYKPSVLHTNRLFLPKAVVGVRRARRRMSMRCIILSFSGC